MLGGMAAAYLLRLTERLGWRMGALVCIAVMTVASAMLTLMIELLLGVPVSDLWIGLCISILAPVLIGTPCLAVGLKLVTHLARLHEALQREVDRRAVAEAKLRRLVTEDELTGLSNRRDFLARARAALSMGRRYRHSVGVLLIDLDNFKAVNDRYGHLVGDEALVRVARLLRHHLRETDTAARIGGDELVALLPQADTAAAMMVAERIRAAVADDPGEPALAVTIGCAVSNGGRVQIAHLLRSADQALYAGKRAGRNCVFFAGRTGPVTAAEAVPRTMAH